MLRHERDLARVAHAHTREMFEGRIHSLEAQLARRDAELEARAEHVGYVALEPSVAQRRGMQKGKRFKMEAVSIAEEEAMTMLQWTTGRNKALEEDIKGLFRRVCILLFSYLRLLHVVQLEQARIANKSSLPPLPPPAQSSPEHAPNEIRPEAIPVDTHPDSPPALSESLTMDAHVVYPLSPQDTLHHDVVIKPANYDNQSPHHHHHQTALALNKQIAELSATIDAFKAERDALREVVASQRYLASVSSARF
jgi:hypothetical protein